MVNIFKYLIIYTTLFSSILLCNTIDEIGAKFPYRRYEAESGNWSTGAILHESKEFIQDSIGSEASNQSYVGLLHFGSYIEWSIVDTADGINVRFTLPDSPEGDGVNGLLGVYVNGEKVTDVPLSSYWSWQYFPDSNPRNLPSIRPRMRFDEVHFRLDNLLIPGYILRFVKEGVDNYEYGIDFIEIERVPEKIPKPGDALTVTDFGAIPDDSLSDWQAFNSCMITAKNQGKNVYIPEGKYFLDKQLFLNVSDIKILGAGIWYTEVYFNNRYIGGGGIVGTDNCSNVEIAHIYFNSFINSRFYNDDPNKQYVYKCFMGTFGSNSVIHDIWEEHFECGFWIGDYEYPLSYTNNLLVYNCRIRNNYADGVNFTQGTSNSIVRNCNIRNNGDDALACWPNNYLDAKMSEYILFENNTIEHNWRAGGIAIFGGDGHIIRGNLIKDNFAGSGIRLTTDFGGYNFENTSNISFENNLILHCGTSYDLWGCERGAIELSATKSEIKNINFRNLFIKDSQRDAIMIGGNSGFENIYFENVEIDGTGLDPYRGSKFIEDHEGKAIVAYAGKGYAEISGLKIFNIESDEPVYVRSGFNLKITYSNIPLEGIKINSNYLNLPRLKIEPIYVSPIPQYATNYEIIWELVDTNIATIIDTNISFAKVLGKSVGQTYLIARTPDQAFKDTCVINVIPAVNIYSPVQYCAEGDSMIVIIDAPGISDSISVRYRIEGSATLDSDFKILPINTVNLNPSKYTDTLIVWTTDDGEREGPEYIELEIENNPNYRVGGNKTCLLTIIDDDIQDINPPIIGVTRTPCIIDGNIDPMWYNTPATAIEKVVIGEMQKDFFAEWKAMADDSNLYVLVEVKDSVKIKDSGTQWWEDDAIEVFIDGDNSKKTSYDGINDFQLGFRINDSNINIGVNSLDRTNNIKFIISELKDGYILELLIPWQTIGISPGIGDAIGFDIGIDDDDNGGKREAQIVSLAKDETGWRNPSVLGSVYIGMVKNKIGYSVINEVKEFKVYRNYPNPFNLSTSIEYDLPYKSDVYLEIFNINGQLIKKMVKKQQEPGRYTVIFNAHNLSSGVYFYLIKTKSQKKIQKMLIIK